MTTKDPDISVVIFDDEAGRRNLADLLRDETGYLVHFIDLENRKVIDEVLAATQSLPPPRIVLVDHVLHKALAESAVQKGTSIVPFLREQWPDAAVIAVTAAYRSCIADIDSGVYDDVVPLEQFSEFVKYAPSIVAGFQEISDASHDLDGLLSLLNVPDAEKEALISSIPSTIKRSLDESSLPHRIFRWFRHTFHRRPGFLLDRRWTAVAIGVDEKYFVNYESQVLSARYDGIFADSNDPRWWSARLYAKLLPKSCERFTVHLCKAAKQTLQIPDDHQSACFRCGEKWPEVMGFVDESATEEKGARPLHLRCSRRDPLSTPEPYYQERRIMLDAD